MAIDPYALCPCGSGKKLKFCCTDLVGEIEKIHRMIEGDQPRAALNHIEQVLRKHPDRASLLDIKAMLELSLSDLASAEATISHFVNVDPQNPTAHAQLAILASAREEAQPAVDHLQEALALVESNLPQRVYEAIGSVGHCLLVAGNLVAARAHLWLFQGISGPDDTRALELLVRLNQMAGLPLLLRDNLFLKELPAEHPAYQQSLEARKLGNQGKWQLALDRYAEIIEQYGQEPSLIFNLAVLCGWLGNSEAFVKGLHDYARRDVPLDDAVEAEAIAQLLDTSLEEERVESVRREYQVLNEDELIERLVGDPRTPVYQIDPSDYDEQEGPPPRHAFTLLDRPRLTGSTTELTVDQVPRIIGFIAYYGRQTDRAERLELVSDRDDQFEKATGILSEVGGDALGESTFEEVVGNSPRSTDALSWRWHLNPDVPPAKRRELIIEERRRAILQRWPEVRRATLDNRTPREAAQDPEMKIPVLAAILQLEHGSNTQIGLDAFAQLRRDLGLPEPELVHGSDVDASRIPLARVHRIDLATLDDDQLVSLYRRAVLAGVNRAIKQTAREAIGRPGLAERIPPTEAFERLISVEEDSQEALRIIDVARQRFESEGKSTGHWDLMELEVHISDGHPERAQQVLQHLQQEHLHEPEVAQKLYTLLYSLGAIRPQEGAPPTGAPTESFEPQAPAPASGGLWTPDSPASPAPHQQSKIWTPG